MTGKPARKTEPRHRHVVLAAYAKGDKVIDLNGVPCTIARVVWGVCYDLRRPDGTVVMAYQEDEFLRDRTRAGA